MTIKSSARINTEMLRWAREQAGFSIDEAIKPDITTKERLKEAEKGTVNLSFPQLIKIAHKYKRPVSFFYLPHPPSEEQIPDFRSVANQRVQYSSLLRSYIQKINEKREFLVEYQKYSQEFDYSFLHSISIDQDPEAVASRIMSFFGIDTEERKKWKDEYSAFNAWKNALEGAGILVFQVSRLPVDEMRGFSISQKPYPTIALNRGDVPQARIFSLIHEFCHVLLEKGALCSIVELDADRYQDEVFCNAVSGAVLVPKRLLLEEPIVQSHVSANEWRDEEIGSLKKKFKVSNEVILRRLLSLDLTTPEFYKKMRDKWSKQPKPKPEGGGEEGYQITLRTHPKIFIRTVLNALNKNDITLVDVSYLLDMKLKHLKNLEEHLDE
jgi:Zn-dependent peptidase ImmA (M78 family)